MLRASSDRPRHPDGSLLSASPPRPLVVTADDALLDDLLRISAAAGTEADVAHDAGSARSSWAPVPIVVVGEDLAADLAHRAPPRRRDVHLVTRAHDDPAVWRHAVDLGAERVAVLPDDESWLADRLADATEGDSGAALVIGVVGGRGGAGASVLATAVSLTASRRGLGTMLIDFDPLGGGLDLVLGAEETVGLRWPDLAGSQGRLSARALREELPGKHGLAVLSWDRGDAISVGSESAQAVLGAARRACDVVVLDLPRHLDPAAEQAASTCSTVLLVVPAEVRAVAAAGRVTANLTSLAGDVRVVSRGASRIGIGGPDVAAALELPLALHMASERRLTDHLDRGDPPAVHERGPLAEASGRLLDNLLFEHQACAP